MEAQICCVDTVFCKAVEVHLVHLDGGYKKPQTLIKAIKNDMILLKLASEISCGPTNIVWLPAEEILSKDVKNLFCTRKLVADYTHSLELSVVDMDEINPLTSLKYVLYLDHFQGIDQSRRSNLVYQEMFFLYLDLLITDYLFTNATISPNFPINNSNLSLSAVRRANISFFTHNIECIVERRVRRRESQKKHRAKTKALVAAGDPTALERSERIRKLGKERSQRSRDRRMEWRLDRCDVDLDL
jgi:hypothetical protein